MGILDEISSATGNKASNEELVKQCLKTPALLHTVAEGLRTGDPKARQDCAQILNEVGQRRPELIAGFVNDLLETSRSRAQPLAKLGFEGLATAARVSPSEVYAQRDYLLESAKAGGAAGLKALEVVAALCGLNPNYRGKLLGSVLRLLGAVADKDLLRWLVAAAPAVAGSADSIKRLESSLAPRRAALAESEQKKLDRIFVKLERSALKQPERPRAARG